MNKSNPTSFAVKNANRREAYRANPDRNARTLRRKLGGAFGNESPELFNQLVVGTTGTPREKGKKN